MVVRRLYRRSVQSWPRGLLVSVALVAGCTPERPHAAGPAAAVSKPSARIGIDGDAAAASQGSGHTLAQPANGDPPASTARQALPLNNEPRARIPGQSASRPSRPRGVVYVFPGIEGGQWAMGLAICGLRDAGLDSDVRFQEWGLPLGVLANLMLHERNRQEAARIAREISAYARGHRDSPIQLIGYSGGGGMALMVVEALPEDVHLRNIVLVHAAVSRDYDLRKALAHVDGQIINLHSPADAIILGTGTTLCGNMDGGKGPAAGKDGFVLEQAAPDKALRSRVLNVPWSRAMLHAGHGGGHFEILLYDWNKEFVAPHLRLGPLISEDVTKQTIN